MTYDYKCDGCNTTHSVERAMSEAEVLPICTSCQKNMTRVWAVGGVSFNGSGFYSTDNPK
jgi:putative FmdB family regulatory protein